MFEYIYKILWRNLAKTIEHELRIDAYDQHSVESRNDAIIFEIPPLSQKVEVVGQRWAHLWVMPNCTNTNFTVKITDVYPDGRLMLLTDGIINMIRRDGFDLDVPPLSPG